jgi:hypothetical protein
VSPADGVSTSDSPSRLRASQMAAILACTGSDALFFVHVAEARGAGAHDLSGGLARAAFYGS